MEKIIKQEAENLFKKIGVEASINVEQQDEIYKVSIETSENALLIGKHGNTLASLELVLSLIVAKKAGEFKRITLEVGNYRQEREEYLRNLALKFKEEVVSTDNEKSVRGLKPWERRFIHLLLQDDPEVETESVGEDRDRTLIIRKK